MDKKAIGLKLKDLRGDKKVVDVAKAIGVSQSTISMYETGERVPRDSIKVKLANFFGVSVESIFFAEQLHETCNFIEPKQTNLTDKCGSCEWAMPIKGSKKGVFGSYIECLNPNKVWKHNCSKHKQRTAPKCRLWQPKEKGGAE